MATAVQRLSARKGHSFGFVNHVDIAAHSDTLPDGEMLQDLDKAFQGRHFP
jgi:hypothetical protein